MSKAVVVRAQWFVVAVLLTVALLRPAHAETTFGVQGIDINGTHAAQFISTPLVGVAAMLEARQRFRAFDIDLEGVPPTGAHGYISGATGFTQPFTSFSYFTASADARIGPTRRFWAGAGETVINQITSVGSPPQSAASRLVGGRYQAIVDLPVGPNGAVELHAAVMPGLHGTLTYLVDGTQINTQTFNSETAEATDTSIAYIVRARRFRYAIGFRSINFVAYFVTPHELADRNVIYGPTLEVRYVIAK